MTRIYIAASLRCAPLAEAYADKLRVHGFRLVSTWHSEVGVNASDPLDESERLSIGIENMAQLSTANAMLFLAGAGTPRAAYSEFGVACHMAMPVVYLTGPSGEGRCIWDSMPHVRRVDRENQVIPAFQVIDRELQEQPSATRMRLPSVPPSEASGAFRAAAEFATGTRKAGGR